MIDHTLDEQNSILYVRPRSALAEDDFRQLAIAVDPHIERTGDLRGIIIEAQTFPGWEDLGAMSAHIRFVRDHHRRIKKVAVVTDSVLATVAERLGTHFVGAEIRRFPAGHTDAAIQWIMAES